MYSGYCQCMKSILLFFHLQTLLIIQLIRTPQIEEAVEIVRIVLHLIYKHHLHPLSQQRKTYFVTMHGSSSSNLSTKGTSTSLYREAFGLPILLLKGYSQNLLRLVIVITIHSPLPRSRLYLTTSMRTSLFCC